MKKMKVQNWHSGPHLFENEVHPKAQVMDGESCCHRRRPTSGGATCKKNVPTRFSSSVPACPIQRKTKKRNRRWADFIHAGKNLCHVCTMGIGAFLFQVSGDAINPADGGPNCEKDENILRRMHNIRIGGNTANGRNRGTEKWRTDLKRPNHVQKRAI